MLGLARVAEALRQWTQTKWPGAEWCRERPVLYRDQNGSVVRGCSDLVLRATDWLVVVDHKSFPGSILQALVRAAERTGQSSSCTTAIEAVAGMAVHLFREAEHLDLTVRRQQDETSDANGKGSDDTDVGVMARS
jgi:hypothetical protein